MTEKTSNSTTERKKIDFKKILLGFSRVGALLLLSLGITLMNPNFLKPSNLINVLRTSSPQMIMSFGMTFVMLTGGIDLSIGSVVTVTSILAGFFLEDTNLPWYVAIIASLGAGALSGLITGSLISVIKLPPAVATYGMLWVGKGLGFAINGASPYYNFPDAFRYLGKGILLGIPVPVWTIAVLIIFFTLFLKYTVLGRNFYAIGANPHAARASGINVGRTLLWAYILSGIMAAIAGLILAGRLNAVDPDMGAQFLLPAIASPVMGGTSMTGGQGGIGGTVVGALLMIVVANGMNLIGISSLW